MQSVVRRRDLASVQGFGPRRWQIPRILREIIRVRSMRRREALPRARLFRQPGRGVQNSAMFDGDDAKTSARHVALDREVCDTHFNSRFSIGVTRRISSMRPKGLSAASVAILLSLVCIDGASAAGGCGAGFHRGPYGACQPNRGPVVVVPAAPAVVRPAPVVVAPAPVVCGAGFRWHPRLRRAAWFFDSALAPGGRKRPTCF